MTRGRFITLEGGEGAGKSTQCSALAAALRERGLEVVQTREPGGSAGAEAIRTLLLTGAADKWNPRAEALLFAAARSDHLDKLILPALDRGAWVVCDRFVDSSRAYQGDGSGLCDDDVITLHKIGSGGLLPDRTFMLSLSNAEATARAYARDGGASDRFAARDAAYHDRVNKAFMAIALQEPQRCRVIDASASPEDVTRQLLEGLSDLLP